MDEAWKRKLTVSRIQLLDRIDSSCAFVEELATVGCIRCVQKEYIMDIEHRRDRNDKLLDFLTRRSVDDFNKFVEVLSKQQPHLVHFLITDGGESYFASL